MVRVNPLFLSTSEAKYLKKLAFIKQTVEPTIKPSLDQVTKKHKTFVKIKNLIDAMLKQILNLYPVHMQILSNIKSSINFNLGANLLKVADVLVIYSSYNLAYQDFYFMKSHPDMSGQVSSMEGSNKGISFDQILNHYPETKNSLISIYAHPDFTANRSSWMNLNSILQSFTIRPQKLLLMLKAYNKHFRKELNKGIFPVSKEPEISEDLDRVDQVIAKIEKQSRETEAKIKKQDENKFLNPYRTTIASHEKYGSDNMKIDLVFYLFVKTLNQFDSSLNSEKESDKTDQIMIGFTTESLKRGNYELDQPDYTEYKFLILVENELTFGFHPETSSTLEIFEIIPNYVNFHFGKIDILGNSGMIITSNDKSRHYFLKNLIPNFEDDHFINFSDRIFKNLGCNLFYQPETRHKENIFQFEKYLLTNFPSSRPSYLLPKSDCSVCMFCCNLLTYGSFHDEKTGFIGCNLCIQISPNSTKSNKFIGQAKKRWMFQDEPYKDSIQVQIQNRTKSITCYNPFNLIENSIFCGYLEIAKPKKLKETNYKKAKHQKLNFERKFVILGKSILDPENGFSLLGFDKKFDIAVISNTSSKTGRFRNLLGSTEYLDSAESGLNSSISSEISSGSATLRGGSCIKNSDELAWFSYFTNVFLNKKQASQKIFTIDLKNTQN